MIGMPRHVRKLPPKMFDDGRRNATTRALAADRRDRLRVRKEERWLLPHARDQVVEVVRGGGAAAGLCALGRHYLVQQAVVRVVEKFALLTLLHLLDREAQLLAHLVVGAREQVRDAGLDLEHRGDGVERVLARVLLVVDERLWEVAVALWAALDVGDAAALGTVLDTVDAVHAGLNRHPLEQRHHPAGRDALPVGALVVTVESWRAAASPSVPERDGLSAMAGGLPGMRGAR